MDRTIIVTMKERHSTLEKTRRVARRDALAFLDQQRGGRLTEGKAGTLAGAARAWARRRPLDELRGKVMVRERG